MLVQFYYKAVENGKSEDGLPRFEDQVWIKIARDMTHTVDRKAKDTDFSQFRELYEAFQRSTAEYEKVEGYPLEMWSALKPAEVQNFKTRGYRTVQDVMAADTKKMPPEYKVLVSKAKEFVELAGAGKGLTEKAEQLMNENDRLKDELSDAKKQLHLLRSSEEA